MRIRKPYRRAGVAAVILAALAGQAGAQPLHTPCTVARVIDGDTLACESGLRVRLADIDAPEVRGGCLASRIAGRRAAAALRDWTEGETISLEIVGMSWGRAVAFATLDGVEIGTRLLAAGHARSWRHEGGQPVEPRPDWCPPSPAPRPRP